MSTLQNVITTTWELGELAPEYHDRIDGDIRNRGAKKLKNWLPSRAGTVKTRPGTSAPIVTSGELWDDDFTRDVSGVQKNEFRVIPYRTRFGDGDKFLVISRSSTSTTFNVHVYTIDADGVTAVRATVGTFVGPSTSFNMQDLIFNYVQAGETLLVAMEFVGLISFTPKVPFTTPFFDIVKQPQLWKELVGTVSFTNGSTAVTGTGTLFAEEYGVAAPPGAPPAGNQRIRDPFGNEYVVVNVVSNTSLTIAGPSGHIGPTVVDVLASRWAVTEDGATKLIDQVACVTIFQNRVVIANGGNAFPGDGVKIWMSKQDDPFLMIPADYYVDGIQPDDSPIAVQLVAQSGDEILWAEATDRLMFGGLDNIYVTNLAAGEPVTPSNVASIGAEGRSGTANIRPTVLDNSISFISRNLISLLGLRFDFGQDGFFEDDASVTAHHLMGDIIDMQLKPARVSDDVDRNFLVKDDGTVAIASDFGRGQAIAWSTIEVPTNNLEIVDVFSIKQGTYLALRRNIGGSYGVAFVKLQEEINDGYLLDLRHTPAPVAATTAWVTTEQYFRNRDIFVIGREDGVAEFFSIGFLSVDGAGNFTTPVALVEIIFGFNVDCKFEPLIPVANDERGISHLRKTRIPSLRLNIRNTKQLHVNEGKAFSEFLQGNVELPTRSEVFRHVILGWAEDHVIIISNAAAYSAEISSMTTEIAI